MRRFALACLVTSTAVCAARAAVPYLSEKPVRFTGIQASSFGAAVAFGDVDGDEIPDLLVGAPQQRLNDGAVHVFYGNPDLRGGSLFGASGARFGSSLAVADVDKDGFEDILSGAPQAYFGGGRPGGASVISGKTRDLLYAFTGSTAGQAFGHAVAAGDFDKDTYPDIVISSPLADVGIRARSGKVQIFSGKTGALLRELSGPRANMAAGAALAVADLNDDGFLDVVVGAPGYTTTRERPRGSVLIFSGKNGALLRELTSGKKVLGLGASLACADLNNDDIPDVIAGAPASTPSNLAAAGTVLAYSGADWTVLRLFNGTAAGVQLGSAVATGDVNGDGNPEIILGAPGTAVRNAQRKLISGVGEILVYSRAGALLTRRTGDPALDGRMGQALATANIDAPEEDGVELTPAEEVLVGAPHVGNPAGRALLFSGQD